VKKYFKPIVIGLIVIFILLFVWMNQWTYPGNGGIRINRITGATYLLGNDGWERVGKNK
jgi:uncharacterized membrane protein (DUF106 family)